MNIIITGTSRGIGKGLCEHFLSKRHNVAGCSRSPSTIKHENYLHYELDVHDESKVVSMVRDVYRQLGQVDALINNAGIASMNHLFLTPVSTLEKVFATNVFGTFLFLRETAKVMKTGRIVNMATVATPLNLEGELAYASSKAAVETMTKIAARELARFNITVNAVGPTPVPTDLIKSVPKEKMDKLLDRQAIKRFGNIEDVINVIDFFLKPTSNFVTGQIVYLGGV